MFGTLNPFRALLPHSRVSPANPLFSYYVRRVDWWQNWQSPLRYGLLLLGWTVLIVLVLGLLTVAALVLAADTERHLMRMLYGVFDYSFIGLLVVGLLLDYLVIAATLAQMVGGRDPLIEDLLHMTTLTAGDVVTAQHAMVRVQTWRLTLVLVAARLALLVLYCAVGWFGVPLLTGRGGVSMAGVIEQGVVVGVLLFLVVEPLWRYRMVTAVGLALAPRFQSVFSALAAGVFTVLLLLTVPQAVFLPRLLISLVVSLATVVYPLLDVIGVLVLGAAIYVAYFSLENVALKRARQSTFREGRDDDLVEEHQPV